MRGAKSAMTPAQQHGMQVFQKAKYTLCHNGPMLSDYLIRSMVANTIKASRREFRAGSQWRRVAE
jgi:cytochrome c peroxidase